MNATVLNRLKASTLIGLGLAIAAMGIYVANADDAPGAAAMGMVLLVIGVVLGVKAARNQLPRWAARTALAVGGGLAAFAAFLTRAVVVSASLVPPAGGAVGGRLGAASAVCGGRRASAGPRPRRRRGAAPAWRVGGGRGRRHRSVG